MRAFPAVALGTMGGRFQTHGWQCGEREYLEVGTTTSTTTKVSNSSTRRVDTTPGMDGVLDMKNVRDQTGFPVKYQDLPSTVKIKLKADIHSGSAANGLENVFLDTYWHDVSNVNYLPSNDANLKDTIDGINEDFTEVWNLNIWFDRPTMSTGDIDENAVPSNNRRSDNGWAGGNKIGTVTRGNGTFDVYFKKEISGGLGNACILGTEDNCFLYIGLVADASTRDKLISNNGFEIDFKDIADWFADESGMESMLKADTVARQAWDFISDGNGNNNSGPDFPGDNHVIGGLHVGSEIWYNPNGSTAEVTFSKLGFKVGNETYGLY